ncbi:MAG TPA: hypothetical protein VFV28_01610 [Limnobacter sp.]|nr:hypothetical protein [Limnobacter sp.]
MKHLSFGALAFSLLLAGCAASWKPVDKEVVFKGPGRAYLVNLPAGWKRAPTKDQDHLVLTRDGLSLQQIAIYRFSLSEPFPAVPATRKFTREDWQLALAEELAGYQLQQLKAGLKVEMESEPVDDDGFLLKFSVTSSLPFPSTVEQTRLVPRVLAQKTSFQLETTSFNNWGLKYNTHSSGFVHEGAYWLVQYSAPALHYWDESLPVFEQFRQSMELKEKCFLFCS